MNTRKRKRDKEIERITNTTQLLQPQFGNIRALDLSRMQLTSIPEELGTLKLLESLNLRKNGLRSCDIGWSWMRQMTRLGTLNISGNDLVRIPSQIIASKSITDLDASENEIIHEWLKEPHDPLIYSLKSLNLSNNEIRWIPGELLVAATALGALDISCNDIMTTHEYQNLRLNSALTWLDMSECKIKERIPEYISMSRNLRWVNLRHNKIKIVSSYVLRMTSLQSLDLSYNKKLCELKNVFGIPNLKEINLIKCGIDPCDPEFIGAIVRNFICAKWSGFTYNGVDGIISANYIESVDLSPLATKIAQRWSRANHWCAGASTRAIIFTMLMLRLRDPISNIARYSSLVALLPREILNLIFEYLPLKYRFQIIRDKKVIWEY